MDSSRTYRPTGTDSQRAGKPADAGPLLDEVSLGRLASELRGLTAASLEQALKKFFVGADDALFDMARKAGNNRDQARFLEAMRSLRLGRAWIQQSFAQEIERSFQPQVASQPGRSAPAGEVDSLALADSADLEKTIAISNIANRANELFKQPLWQLGRRLNTLIHAGYAPISPQALAPISFCEAFRIAVDSQKLESGHALLLYQLFDRIVIPELDKLYARLLEVFDRYSIRPDKVSVSNPSAQELAPPASPRGSSSHGPVVETSLPRHPELSGAAANRSNAASIPGDPRYTTPAPPLPKAHGSYALEMLRQLRPTLSGVQPGQSYTDQHLADDLIGAALGRMIPGWEPAHAQAYVRRTDAVGQMFNGIIEDPDMPDELKPRFDELRFTVIKTALQDVNFFANPAHPVRGLVNDLAALAAAARATSVETLKRVNELVGQIQNQFRVAAASVRHPRTDPLENTEIEAFLADQIDRNRERRKAVIEKSKRIVEEELQLRCARHNVPNTALTLLRSGWAPMMAAHLMRSGIDSAPWQDGLKLLEHILTALDPEAPPSADGPAALVASIDQQLSDVGMIGTRRKELLDAFLPALRQAEIKRRGRSAETQAVTAGAPSVSLDSLLQALIIPGSWYRIVDPATQQNRWMRAVAHYPGHGNVAFAEFNGRNPLFIEVGQFLENLLGGTLEPLELLPMAKDLLDRYRLQTV